MDHLIAKYLTQELTEGEAEELKAWLESDPVNREVFENIVGRKHISSKDIEVSKEKIRRRLSRQNIGTTDFDNLPKEGSDSFWNYAKKIAAVVVLGVAISGIWYLTTVEPENAISQNTIYLEKETLPGQKMTFQLPDGSTVKLNSESTFSYKENNLSNSREVQLAGEAFFEVARDEQRPFTIQAKNLSITVLGTSFNVKAFPEEANSSVAVTTGEVAVSENHRQFNKKKLLPGQMLSYSEISGQARLTGFEWDEQLGWTENVLYFRDNSLMQVVSELSRWYGVTITLEKVSGKDRRITAKFKQSSLEEILKSLSIAYDFDYELKEKQVIIRNY